MPGGGLFHMFAHSPLRLIIAFTPILPVGKQVTLPGLNTLQGLVNDLSTAVLVIGLVGFIGAAVFFVVEAKHGHGAGMHSGHRLALGAAIACILTGGAVKLVSVFAGFGAGL
ncbi:MAG: hypothetical protein ACYDEY_15860 [Acidimicrobiales bacterium]